MALNASDAAHADGALTLRFVARSLHEVKRWVLDSGKGEIGQQPLELVALLHQELIQMNYNYSNSSGEKDAGN